MLHWIAELWLEPHSYNFFSTSFPEFLWQMPVAIFALRHLNCNVTGCKRVGHKVNGTSHRACRKHHPTLKTGAETTAAHIAEDHAEAKERAES